MNKWLWLYPAIIGIRKLVVLKIMCNGKIGELMLMKISIKPFVLSHLMILCRYQICFSCLTSYRDHQMSLIFFNHSSAIVTRFFLFHFKSPFILIPRAISARCHGNCVFIWFNPGSWRVIDVLRSDS